MKKALFTFALVTGAAFSASATDFCQEPAISAAKALAQVNGTVSEVINVATQDGKNFRVTLFEENVGVDMYMVSTSGGHECTVYSVTVEGEPTRVP